MNPAQCSALVHAQRRANREGKACHVYVSGPHARQVFSKSGFNVWYVLIHDEPAPQDSELYRVIVPQP